jgi:hypothetical protein
MAFLTFVVICPWHLAVCIVNPPLFGRFAMLTMRFCRAKRINYFWIQLSRNYRVKLAIFRVAD